MSRIFISYSRKDGTFVSQLAQDLKARGWDVWWDISSIRGGDSWEKKIEAGLADCDAFIVVLSPASVASRWVTREYISADARGIPIIPLALQPCQIPLTLRDLQPVDVQALGYGNALESIIEILATKGDDFLPKKVQAPGKKNRQAKASAKTAEETGKYRTLKLSIVSTRQTKTGIAVYELGGLEFVKIPQGKFLIGQDGGFIVKTDRANTVSDYRPQHSVDIPYDYLIGRYQVTKPQFGLFQAAIIHIDDALSNILSPFEFHDPALEYWNEIQKYLAWLNQKYKYELPEDYVFRLPSEAEWEKAARGTDGREYPWGNEDDESRYKKNTLYSSVGSVKAHSPAGDSPFGAANMIGNGDEWTQSIAVRYPYNAEDGRESLNFEDGCEVIMRGSITNYYRFAVHPATMLGTIRVCVGPPLA